MVTPGPEQTTSGINVPVLIAVIAGMAILLLLGILNEPRRRREVERARRSRWATYLDEPRNSASGDADLTPRGSTGGDSDMPP